MAVAFVAMGCHPPCGDTVTDPGERFAIEVIRLEVDGCENPSLAPGDGFEVKAGPINNEEQCIRGNANAPPFDAEALTGETEWAECGPGLLLLGGYCVTARCNLDYGFTALPPSDRSEYQTTLTVERSCVQTGQCVEEYEVRVVPLD